MADSSSSSTEEMTTSSSSSTEIMTTSSGSSSSSSSTEVMTTSSSSSSSTEVMTTSSSYTETWNKTKPLLLGNSSINNILPSASFVLGNFIGVNRLAQTIYLEDDEYDIGTVYCYFYGRYGSDDSYDINLEIYECDNDGKPSSLITSRTLSASSITGNNWYSFNVGIEGLTPTNRYISFVIWQNGGDEDNYVLWGYDTLENNDEEISYLSNDSGTTWTRQDGIVRALRVTQSFDVYDLINHRVITPPATSQIYTQNMDGAVHNGTKLVDGGEYDTSKIVIDYPKTLVSFVVDSSGSMGWNDRTNVRANIITSVIEKFKEKYPGNVIFDIVKFGGINVDADSLQSDLGTPEYINLDLNSPTRRPFVFQTDSANVSSSAVYSNNNYSFTMVGDVVSGSSVIATSGSDSLPHAEGILTRVSGAGDVEIEYGSYRASSVADGIVSLGFKNFIDSRAYNIGEIVVGGSTQEVTDVNWQILLANGAMTFLIDNNGPNSSLSIDINGNSQAVFRRPTTTFNLDTSKITSNVDIGDTTVNIEDTSDFPEDSVIDFISVDSYSLGHTVTSSNSSALSLNVFPSVTSSVLSWVNGGGMVQTSNLNNPALIFGTTAQLLVRDIETVSGNSLTFFVQTTDGNFLEWDFVPFKDWIIYNRWWLGETAILPLTMEDTDGNPLPDGLEIQFFVDEKPPLLEKYNKIESSSTIKDASIGEDKIYVLSTEGYSMGMDIDILNNKGEFQTVTIVEIGEDGDGEYLKFTPVLIYDFNIDDRTIIVPSQVELDEANVFSQISDVNLLNMTAGVVDVTPIHTGRNLDVSLLKPYDADPVSPDTQYEDLNLDLGRIKSGSIDVPLMINGDESIGVVRILPITEDNLKTVSEKQKDAELLLDAFRTKDDGYNPYDEEEDDVTTTTTTTLPSAEDVADEAEKDYVIESPVYSQGGSAETSMTSYAVDKFVEKSFSVIVPGLDDSSVSRNLMVRNYNVIPVLVMRDFRNEPSSHMIFPSFDIDFALPVNIVNIPDGKNVSYWTEESRESEECPDPSVFSYTNNLGVPGVYAGSDEQMEFEYVVTERNRLVTRGELQIRIYSRSLDVEYIYENMREVVRSEGLTKQIPMEQSDFNHVGHEIKKGVDIDKFRSDVEQNISPSEDGVDSVERRELSTYRQIASDFASLVGGRIRSREATEGLFWNNSKAWTVASQYEQNHFKIPIVNGRAKFILPKSEVDAFLHVQASYYYGENNEYEFIHSSLRYNGNPIDFSPIYPSRINPVGGNKKYEIGTNVLWMREKISDNVSVSFSGNNALPGVSKTDNGWAGGVFIGPYEIFEKIPNVSSKPGCPPTDRVTTIELSADYLGYHQNKNRKIALTGIDPVRDIMGVYIDFES